MGYVGLINGALKSKKKKRREEKRRKEERKRVGGCSVSRCWIKYDGGYRESDREDQVCGRRKREDGLMD